MGLKGSFKEFSVSDIIQLIYFQKKTGRLTVQAGGRLWVIGFEKGMLVHASCEEKGMPRMGEILVRQGYIDRDTLAEALRKQEGGNHALGLVLEEMGKVTHQDIARALNFQIQETTLNLFFYDDGEYLFERVSVSYDSNYITPISTEFVLMEGARRQDEWPAIRRAIKGGDTVLSRFPEATITPGKLTSSHEATLEAVDGETSVDDLIRTLGMGMFETCRLLSDLLSERMIQVTRAGSGPFHDPISGDAVGRTPDPITPDGPSGGDPSTPSVSKKWKWMGLGMAVLGLCAAWAGSGGVLP
ncbi:MAG: DUF4388 domain-containing protein [Leptospirillia bacterium]